MNTLPETQNPDNLSVPGTDYGDRVLGGSKGMATKQARALLNKHILNEERIEQNETDIDFLLQDRQSIPDVPQSYAYHPTLALNIPKDGSFERESNATTWSAKRTVVPVLEDEPRYAINPNSLLTEGILIEDERTNLIAFSEAYSEFFTLNGTVYDGDLVVGLPSIKLETDSSGTSYCHSGSTVDQAYTQGTRYSASCVVDVSGVNTATEILLTLHESAFGERLSVKLNLLTKNIEPVGTSPDFQVGGYEIKEDVFFLCISATCQGNLSTYAPLVQMLSSDVGDSLLIARYQLEEGPRPTSYIPTGGTPVTRKADKFSLHIEDYLDQEKFSFLFSFVFDEVIQNQKIQIGGLYTTDDPMNPEGIILNTPINSANVEMTLNLLDSSGVASESMIVGEAQKGINTLGVSIDTYNKKILFSLNGEESVGWMYVHDISKTLKYFLGSNSSSPLGDTIRMGVFRSLVLVNEAIAEDDLKNLTF